MMSNSCSLMVVISFLLLVGCDNISSSLPNATILCSPDQLLALLHFKYSFSIMTTNFHVCGSNNVSKTESWKEGSDCCRWDGVTCDYLTGDVVALDLSCGLLDGTFYPNSTLFSLHHLRKLNLAWNYFNYSEIPSAFCGFTKLTHLNLSSSYFSGPVPSEISYLSNLLSLDISSSVRLEFSPYSFDRLCLNLTKLKVLALDGVNMSSIPPSSLLNLSSSLTSLHLSFTGLQGKFPKDVLHFPLLEQLDLSGNGPFTGGLPNYNWSSIPPAISNLTKLTYLALGEFSSIDRVSSSHISHNSLPSWIFNLTHLSYLSLSGMQLDGHLPSQLCSLVHLTQLDLSTNFLSGTIPSCFFLMPSMQQLYLYGNSLTSLTNLTDHFNQSSPLRELDLSNNDLHGQIPNFVSNLLNLVVLDLSFNYFNGTVNIHLFSKLNNLLLLNLNSNKLNNMVYFNPLNDTFDSNIYLNIKFFNFSNNFNLLFNLNLSFIVPNLIEFEFNFCNLTKFQIFFKKCDRLSRVDLSNNQITEFPSSFSNCGNLLYLGLSNNHISEFPSSFSNCGNLLSLDLSNNQISEFPSFIRNCGNLSFLELSNNQINGRLSREDLTFSPKLRTLDLSHNLLTGLDARSTYIELSFLYLSSNLLQGVLTVPLYAPNLLVFSVSDNNLTGEVPSTICNMSSLQYLELESNHFNGTIPECLRNIELVSLDLSMNHFQGSISALFQNNSNLETINLNGNQLEGPLPASILNSSSLEVFDVGNNMLKGTFPSWLETLPKLQILILRSNRFHGPIRISGTNLSFPKLRIIDIAHNQFTGSLPPSLFLSFKSMMSDGVRGHDKKTTAEYMMSSYSMVLTWKGIDQHFDRILTILTTVDLSSNQFQGRIPEAIEELNLLKVLNLSHNQLTGQIPWCLRNLTELESLDLSTNKLSGKIPMELGSLTFLEKLNLSYNMLEGIIPTGRQLDTFDNTSYIGNSGLCGQPLSRKCHEDKALRPKEDEDDSKRWFWKMVKMGYGSGVVIGLSIGYMVFSTGKPRWFVKWFERNKGRNVRRSRGRSN